ncbi:MAG: protein-(glutamine-N5) methyltransferase, release factor-specific, partial [Pseudoalteromonas shioyasakiensis]
MPQSIEQAIVAATALLTPSSDSAKLDAQVLLLSILDKPRSYLFTWPEKQLTEQQQRDFEQACQRRLNGEPVA